MKLENKVECPHCHSDKYAKRGFTPKGVQRYECKNCYKRFTKNSVHIEKKSIQCPHCKSLKTRKFGHLSSGAQRYFCNDCGKNFSDVTLTKGLSKELNCPSCGRSHTVRAGFTTTGIQRYRCQVCGYRFVENPEQIKYQKHEVTCPRCSHQYAKKAGKSGAGSQYYLCLNCGHKYLLSSKYRHITKEQEKFIITYNLNLGVSKKQIAEYLGVDPRTVYNVIKRFQAARGGK